MDHRERHAETCRQAFEGFVPDFSRVQGDKSIAHKIHDMARNGYYSHEIAAEVGRTPKAIQKFFRRYDFPSLHNIEPPKLSERIGWSGGIKMMKGYAYEITPGHPNGTKHGNYVAVHRLVVEKAIGRLLLKTEVVDHIDGDITNNHPDNLRVFQSNGEHLRATLTGKCPDWSEAGKEALAAARQQPRRTWKGQTR